MYAFSRMFLVELMKAEKRHNQSRDGHMMNISQTLLNLTFKKRLPLHEFLSVPAKSVVFSHGAVAADIARQSIIEADERLQLLN